ncbi:MAG: hypothetical protein JSS82_10855 [Bacteroidetes bacterium]|nr:hypothetical protein [Bacteroidota bacterium]
MNVAASATGWGGLSGHVMPGRTVRSGAWHVYIRVGLCQHPTDTQPVASHASTDIGQRMDFTRLREWRMECSVMRRMN